MKVIIEKRKRLMRRLETFRRHQMPSPCCRVPPGLGSMNPLTFYRCSVPSGPRLKHILRFHVCCFSDQGRWCCDACIPLTAKVLSLFCPVRDRN